MSFSHLVRFEENGQPHYGDLIKSEDSQGHTVSLLAGDPWSGFTQTGQTKIVSKVRTR
jgi:hypothetical protein